MKYLEGFRNPAAARQLVQDLGAVGARLAETGRTVRLMEVCGTHTMSIARNGIRALLPESVELISGPGCPVCVTATGYVDAALELAAAGHIVATFGDLVRVPGSEDNLAGARAQGARVEVCYSPDGALALARQNPERQVVFLAVGFETTIAPLAALAKAVRASDVENLSLLTAFKTVPPALTALLADPEVRVDGFLCPAHVSAIIGAEAYRPFVDDHGVPCVVAGFEALDILDGVRELARQLADDEPALVNQYSRVVRPEGNPVAQAVMAEVLSSCDADWRGIGVIPASGLELAGDYESIDARRRFAVEVRAGRPNPACRCGEVMKGILRPPDCPLFGRVCTPVAPVGPCMVSSEGSCAASYKYDRTS